MPGPAFRRGETVSLHTVEEDDLGFLQRLRNDPANRTRTLASAPENADELTEWFEEDVSALEAEDAQFLAVPTARADVSAGTSPSPAEEDTAAAGEPPDADADRQPAPVGFVSLSGIERPAGRGEVTCTIDRSGGDDSPEQMSSYACEAVELLVGYAIEERRLHRIVAHAPAGDEAYRGVLESAGFTAEHTQREEWLVDGEHVDVVCHAVLADEWGGV